MIARLPAPVRYALVAGICFVLSSTLIPAFAALGLHYALATVVAFVIVVAVGFALHCRWTFQVERSTTGLARYAGAMALNLPLTIVLIGCAHDGLGLSVAWSAPLSSLVLFAWNFVVVRWAVQRNPMSLRDNLSRLVEGTINSRMAVNWRMRDVDAATRDTYFRVAPYTMTSPERIAAVCDAVRHVLRARIPGAYVECGVWRGGSSMAAALTFLAEGASDRSLYLFDTFSGMSAPSEHDLRAGDNTSAASLLEKSGATEKIWCKASIADVGANMASTGYPAERIALCQGMVEDTLPAQAPERIAILRLDTDWYESTRHELEQLWHRLMPGGVLIIDDYGYWAGARKAVDEFFADRPILLNRIDQTGRIAIKLAN